MKLDNLVLEVTRRCNMLCGHCLRGNSQRVDISDEILTKVFTGLSYVNSITLSGGEPSLVPHIIKKVADHIRYSDTEVFMFYIATNGKRIQQPFIDAVRHLENAVEFPEESAIDFSTDLYHKEQGDYNKGYYRLQELSEYGELTCNITKRCEQVNLIAMGRAEKLSRAKKLPHYKAMVRLESDNSISLIDSTIYVSANGEITDNCDLSYSEINKQSFANINDLNFNWNDCISKYIKDNNLETE